MRIVFMGTPDFAVPSLAALLDHGYNVVAAVTQPDRPSGRKMKLTPCPVKVLAEAHGVPVLQFERIRRQEGLDALRALSPDLFVTAAFGQILSQKLLDIPPMGTVNVHASLLPRYRGPAPINWCIIEGETVTGVTTMLTDAGIDTGDMLLQAKTDIGPQETAGELSARLSVLGASLLIQTLERLVAGDCPRMPQDEALATRHPMLTKETGRVDWEKPAWQVANLVRGVSPWPGAWTVLPEGGVLKIWRAHALCEQAPVGSRPGEVLWADGKRGMGVACGDGGILSVDALQTPGKRQMESIQYLCGHAIACGQVCAPCAREEA